MANLQIDFLKNYYAGTSLSCAGIQRWKSVSFRCWAAINLVGEMSKRSRTPHPLPYPPFSFLTAWRVLHPFSFLTVWRVLLMSNEEQDTPYPTHPFPSSLCEEFCMSDNMCISRPSAAVLAYWDPGGSARYVLLCFHKWCEWSQQVGEMSENSVVV